MTGHIGEDDALKCSGLNFRRIPDGTYRRPLMSFSLLSSKSLRIILHVIAYYVFVFIFVFVPCMSPFYCYHYLFIQFMKGVMTPTMMVRPTNDHA